ncbi:MAG: CpaF family protein [Acinetobacter sp.]
MEDTLRNTMSFYRTQCFKDLDPDTIESVKLDRKSLIKEVDKVISQISKEHNRALTEKIASYISSSIADEIEGYGPLRELMEDETVSDILVNGPYKIFIERFGKLVLTPYEFLNNEQLTDIAKRMVAKVGRRIDEAQPLVDARLPDGSRLNVVIPPIALDGTSLSIRKFGKGKKTLGNLVEYGALSEKMANFLVIASRCRLNIIVSGGTGSGKTTLLNALSQYISTDERIVTIEDAAELRLLQPHVVRLETRMAGYEDKGHVTIRQLMVNALRMRPERIIVGECRGEEAFEMLQAMNTGHDGSMSTLHANSPRDALYRLESMVMMANGNLPLPAIRRNITAAVNIVIQVARLSDGSRKVINISELMGMEGDNVIIQDIFSYQASEERDDSNNILGDYICHGLVKRSNVYKHAVVHGLSSKLQSLFGVN